MSTVSADYSQVVIAEVHWVNTLPHPVVPRGEPLPCPGGNIAQSMLPPHPQSAPTLTAFHRDDSLDQTYSYTGIRRGRWESDDHKTTRQKLSQFTRCRCSTRSAQRPYWPQHVW